jgi:hypothetical protein
VLTGTPGPAPLTSSTRAAISVAAQGGSTAGVAVTSTRSAAAVLTRKFSSSGRRRERGIVGPLWPPR